MAKKSDPAHIATDAEIAKIEKLITKEYKKAHKQISEKCDDYLPDSQQRMRSGRNG